MTRGGVQRGLALVAVQLRVNLARAAAYRADFVFEGVMTVVTMALALLPLIVLFDTRKVVAGWDEPSALIVMAYFMAVEAILEGLINPSLVDLVERIRTGAFDYVLLKPVDAQLMVSTSRQEPWHVIDFLGALGLAVYAFWLRGEPPAWTDVLAGLALLVTGSLAVYAVFVVCVAASFWVVRLDNLVYLLGAVFDTARWPVQVFRGTWRIIFTFVIPVAVMTTYPAMALLGRLDAQTAIATVAGTALMLVISRAIWRLAIRSYTSASS